MPNVLRLFIPFEGFSGKCQRIEYRECVSSWNFNWNRGQMSWRTEAEVPRQNWKNGFYPAIVHALGSRPIPNHFRFRSYFLALSALEWGPGPGKGATWNLVGDDRRCCRSWRGAVNGNSTPDIDFLCESGRLSTLSTHFITLSMLSPPPQIDKTFCGDAPRIA